MHSLTRPRCTACRSRRTRSQLSQSPPAVPEESRTAAVATPGLRRNSRRRRRGVRGSSAGATNGAAPAGATNSAGNGDVANCGVVVVTPAAGGVGASEEEDTVAKRAGCVVFSNCAHTTHVVTASHPPVRCNMQAARVQVPRCEAVPWCVQGYHIHDWLLPQPGRVRDRGGCCKV